MNTTKFWDGTMPPEELLKPLGKMVAVQVLQTSEGKNTEGGVILTDAMKSVWTTPLYVATHVGDKCQFVKRGDVLAIGSWVQNFPTLRIDGWELLLVNEEQAGGIVPSKRVLPSEPVRDRLPEGVQCDIDADSNRIYTCPDYASAVKVRNLDVLAKHVYYHHSGTRWDLKTAAHPVAMELGADCVVDTTELKQAMYVQLGEELTLNSKVN